MSSGTLFCCASAKPYRPQVLQHESKFRQFLAWSKHPKESAVMDATDGKETDLTEIKPPYVVQLVRQVNYGPLESKRYFASVEGRDEAFIEVTENDLIKANFQKLNSYKNFKCDEHNKFFEVNLYEKDPVNKHHWRINLARPGSSIDL